MPDQPLTPPEQAALLDLLRATLLELEPVLTDLVACSLLYLPLLYVWRDMESRLDSFLSERIV